jgi:hypothetical protein
MRWPSLCQVFLTKLFNLHQKYDALDEQNSHNLNLLQAAMSTQRDGLTAETYSIEQQLEQDLDACWHMIYNLRHHLNDQNLEINSLCHKNEAYECKEQKQDDKKQDDKVIQEWGRKRPCFDDLSP